MLPTTLSFGNFVVALGNGASPEVFSNPCGFTEKSLEIKATTGDTDVPDCDNPDLPTWTARDVKSLAVTVTGQGVLAMGSLAMWQQWALSGGKKDLHVGPANTALANGGGYFAGVAVCTSLKIDSTQGERCKISVNIESDGVWTWVPAAS